MSEKKDDFSSVAGGGNTVWFSSLLDELLEASEWCDRCSSSMPSNDDIVDTVEIHRLHWLSLNSMDHEK